MKLIIGLTGPTGAGKSLASKIAQDLGFYVVDCDKLARLAVEKGTDGLNALVIAFGSDILNEDGTLNRKILAEKAFKDTASTEKLNNTIFPHISTLVDKECEKSDRILLDAPTLFESGISSKCNATIAVLADYELRLSRIIERDKLNKSAALLRLSAAKSDEFFKNNADYVLYNNNETEIFFTEFKKIILNILGKN